VTDEFFEREPSISRTPSPEPVHHPVIRDGLGPAQREQIFEVAPDGERFARSVMQLPTLEEKLAHARARAAAASNPETVAEHAAAEAAEDRRLAGEVASRRAELDAVNAEILEHQIALADLGRRQAAAQMAWEAIEREPWNRALRRSWAANELKAEKRRADELALADLEARRSAGW